MREEEPRYAKKGTLVRLLRRDAFYYKTVRRVMAERGILAPDGIVANMLSKGVMGNDLAEYADFVSQYLKRGEPTAHEMTYANFLADLKFSPPNHRFRILKKLMQAEGIDELPKKGGRPKKRLEDQKFYFIGELVSKNPPFMTENFEKLEHLRLRWPADPDRWDKELRAQKIDGKKLEAMKHSKTPRAAACRYVAYIVRENLQYVQHAFSQWKKLSKGERRSRRNFAGGHD